MERAPVECSVLECFKSKGWPGVEEVLVCGAWGAVTGWRDLVMGPLSLCPQEVYLWTDPLPSSVCVKHV